LNIHPESPTKAPIMTRSHVRPSDADRDAARLLALLRAHPGGRTLRELTAAYNDTRDDLPRISDAEARACLNRMPDAVFVTYGAATRAPGTETWFARREPTTVPIDTGALPPRDHPVYFARLIHKDDLDGGRVVYRQDPGASCYRVIAPHATADEARCIVVALNDMVKDRLGGGRRAEARQKKEGEA